MINYRNAVDTKVGLAFAALIITVVGSAATMMIIRKAEALTWDPDTRYERHFLPTTEAGKPGTPEARP